LRTLVAGLAESRSLEPAQREVINWALDSITYGRSVWPAEPTQAYEVNPLLVELVHAAVAVEAADDWARLLGGTTAAAGVEGTAL
jgi:hypothetical protein